jgi:Ca-activated chloride channel family protein
MTWAAPFVFFAIPVLVGAAWWVCHPRRRRGTTANRPNIIELWAGRTGVHPLPSSQRGLVRGLLLMLGCAATLLALARPQWGTVEETTIDRSRDVMLAVDLSRSMLAEDVTPNRLARAKLLIEALLDELHGERVGLIVFAGTAFVQSPLSADSEVLRELLPQIDPSYLPQEGTDYTALLSTALRAFDRSGGGDRYLVVLSDGEAHDESWRQLLPDLKKHSIRVIGIGVGTPEGGLIPDATGAVVKDERGAAVLSHLEPQTLEALAEATGGTYRPAAVWVDLADLVRQTVEQGRQGQHVEHRDVQRYERFQWFLLPALLILFLSYGLELPVFPTTKPLSFSRRRVRLTQAAAAGGVLALTAVWCVPQHAFAAATLPGGQPPPPSGAAPTLATTVEELSSKPALAAPDYARLAMDTLHLATPERMPDNTARQAVIGDALAAVDRGEGLDAGSADWPQLRQQLKALLAIAPPPPRERESSNAGQQASEPSEGASESEQHAGDSGSDEESQAATGGAQGEQANDQNASGSDRQQGGNTGTARSSEASERDAGTALKREGQPPENVGGRDSHPSSETQASDSDRESTAQNASGDGEKERLDEAPPHTPEAPTDNAARAPAPSSEEPRPLADADAGLGGLGEPTPPSVANAKATPETRRVGGGLAMARNEGTDPALAGAYGKMEQVYQNDAPGVLFDRMNRVEGVPPRPRTGKTW